MCYLTVLEELNVLPEGVFLWPFDVYITAQGNT